MSGEMIGVQIGHFTIKQKIGQGGMGAVYLAEHDIMRKKVAIKVLLPQWTQRPLIVKRFRNEAVAMASLQHPNIVDIDDCGQLPDGSWYIIMEYLEGGSLSRLCKSRGALSEALTLQILCQTAAALEVAHKNKIVHRDLKPENLFLVARKANPHFVKVLDWGISKLGEQDGSGITNAGMIAGTPAYMAPEQILDLRAVDRRTDVFALGAIAYRMLSGGYLPFQRGDKAHEFSDMSLTAIHDLQMRESPTPLRQRAPSVSERTESAILSALHRDPGRRPQTARQFILLLAAAIPGDGFSPPGADIVKTFAPELLEIGNLEETVRAVKPSDKKKTSSRYRFGDQLGVGGMAEVFRATHVGAEGFERPVAIKRVLPAFSNTPQFATMFVQEAQLASRLDHPNIVSVHDFDRDDEGRLFLTMEYVSGRDLATIANTGPLPISTIIFIVGEMLSGLGYAHNLPVDGGPGSPSGLIHRDVSPQNVLISWEGAVKVSDFGIAKARHASAATVSTMIKGKPQYMSPEQADGKPLDGQSDLFAVGIVLWELLTGRRLFGGTSTEQTFAQIFFHQIPPPSTVARDVPPDVDAVTMRLLARDKSVRYAVAEDAIEDLARCVDAPRNGRAELTRLLAERFPDVRGSRPPPGRASQPPVRASQPPARASQPSAPPSARDAEPSIQIQVVNSVPPHEVQTTRLPSHTTLGEAASQSTPTARRRTASILAGVFVVVAATTSFLGIFIATRRAKARTPEAATVPTAPIDARAIDAIVHPDAPAPIIVPAETTLTVKTDPPGATIHVNGADRGKSPLTLRVPRGPRVTIDVVLDDYEPTRQIESMDRDAQEILFTLRPVLPSPHQAGSASPPKKGDSHRDDHHDVRSRTTPEVKIPSGSGAAGSAEHRPFNPDDAVGD